METVNTNLNCSPAGGAITSPPAAGRLHTQLRPAGLLSTGQRNFHFYVKIDARSLLSTEFQRHADAANWIQHRILVGRYLWQLADGFTLLKSVYLGEIVGKSLVKPLLVEMQRVELIQRDRYYEEGKKAYGYRIGENYNGRKTVRLECRNQRLADKLLAKQQRDFRGYNKVHRHLFKWLYRVSLDLPAVLNIIANLQFEGNDGGLTRAEYRDLHHLAARAIAEKNFDFSVCHYGRVHTNITRLLKPIRSSLMIDGQPLVEIDVANSQPGFMAMTIMDSYRKAGFNTAGDAGFNDREGHSGHPYFPVIWKAPVSGVPASFSPNSKSLYYTIPEGKKNRAQLSTKKIVTVYCDQYRQLPADLSLFYLLCEMGLLYGYLERRTNWEGNRETLKDEVFHIIYGSNRETSRVANLLRADFPTVWEFMRGFKRAYGYEELAREMQRRESQLMIDGVCGRLMNEHPNCPIVTLHDSILTTPPWVELVQQIIREEFHRLGRSPTLKVKSGTRLD